MREADLNQAPDYGFLRIPPAAAVAWYLCAWADGTAAAPAPAHEERGGFFMADDRLPMVFKAGLRVGLICFFCAAVGGVATYAKLSEEYPRSVTFAHFVTIDGRTAGWLFAALTALLAGIAVVALVRGCPRLILDASGIGFSRCLGNPVQIPWSRFAHVEVKRMVVPSSRRSAVVDIVYVVTTEGNRTDVGDCWKASDLEETIRRVAARMKAATPASA
jgi:hypothetical protein